MTYWLRNWQSLCRVRNVKACSLSQSVHNCSLSDMNARHIARNSKTVFWCAICIVCIFPRMQSSFHYYALCKWKITGDIKFRSHILHDYFARDLIWKLTHFMQAFLRFTCSVIFLKKNLCIFTYLIHIQDIRFGRKLICCVRYTCNEMTIFLFKLQFEICK